MKTFETEKHNIPEGATHHGIYGCDTDVYFKNDNGAFLQWHNESWKLSQFAHHKWVKPIPRTNIETPEEKEALDSIVSKITQDNSLASGLADAMLNVRNSIKGEVHLRDYQKETFPANSEGVNEWNGEGLPPVGVECEFVGVKEDSAHKVEIYHTDDNKVMFLGRIESYPEESTIKHFKDGRDLMVFYTREGDRVFRKPETPEAKEKRERLEAAYDLYCHVQKSNNRPNCDIESLRRMEDESPLYTLVVDKTNYRKGAK